ncbi:hypothetical protein MUP77_13115 [Candidatus Bathyarchaeota archaeon]|nr:hypothetical protein [Candidatus Bathyarchaeota archaeon]
MDSERRTITVGALSIAKFVIVVIIIVGLWFLPSLIHLRVEYLNYDETLAIQATGKNYVERGFIVYGIWEADVRITGSFSVNNLFPARIFGLDSQMYNYWKDGMAFSAIYFSGVTAAENFNIPIPSGDGQQSTYYLVFQNPNSQSIDVKYNASISFERAFLGYSYIEWVSRIGIFILLFVVLASVFKRYSARALRQHGSVRENIGESNKSSPKELIQAPPSSLSKGRPMVDVMLRFVDYVDIDGGKYVSKLLEISDTGKVTFDLDVDGSETIDFYVFDEKTLSSWDVGDYASLSSSRKTFYACISANNASHQIIGWTPPSVGNYQLVLDNSSSPTNKRCRIGARF